MFAVKTKFLLIGTLIFMPVMAYLLVADEDLKPTTQAWLEVFTQKIDKDNNASLRLLALGKTDPLFISTVKDNYNAKLAAFKHEGVLGDEKPIKYPNVLQFEAFLESPLFCDFSEPNCFTSLQLEADYLNIVIQEFQPELNDFMSLKEVANFEALNPFVAELKLDDFLFLFKLKGTDIYFDIYEGRLALAARKLDALIQINRQFFSKSEDLLTKISFSVNTENVFQPLLLLLKEKGYSNIDDFELVLGPLSMQEISADEIQIRSFAKNARLIKAGLAAREQNSSGSFFSSLWHQIVYKQNMTLNDMFDEYQPLLLPAFVNKPSLLAFSINIDKEITAKSELQLKRPLLYRFKNINNLVGASLKDVIMPRQVNLYESIAALDTRMQLLRLVLVSNASELANNIQRDDYTNYYTGEKPFIADEKVCHTLNQENVCVAF